MRQGSERKSRWSLPTIRRNRREVLDILHEDGNGSSYSTHSATPMPLSGVARAPTSVISSENEDSTQIAARIPSSLNRQTTMKKPAAIEITKSGSSGGLTTRDAGLDSNRMGALPMTFSAEWVCNSRSAAKSKGMTTLIFSLVTIVKRREIRDHHRTS